MNRKPDERSRGAAWVVPLTIAILTFLAFVPALRGEFVTWDDNRNFLENTHYRGLGASQLRWMWSTFLMGHYIPFSWMTLGMDYVLWGMNPVGYHLTNLVLHAANAVVLYFLTRRLLRLTGIANEFQSIAFAIPAALGVLLFAIHPLRVESVAWITERRDMLSLLFYLSSIIAYLRAIDETSRFRLWSAIALTLFACALLSKGTAVTLPAVLLILNVYPLRRLGGRPGWWSADARRVWLELLPFARFSAAISVLSIAALTPPDQLTAGGKVAVSAYSLVFYLWKTLVPVNLSPLYEMPKNIDPVEPRFLASYFVVIVLCALAWSARKRWPGVTAACLAFFVMLLPLLGVVQNGPQIAADRYTYHAATALTVLAAGVLSRSRQPLAAGPLSLLGGFVLFSSALTWRQSRIWRDSESLWTRVVQLQPESSIGQVGMAAELLRQDRVSEAIAHYTRAIELDPQYAEGYNNLGVALARQARFAEAIQHYKTALSLKQKYAEAHNNWGIALAQQGKVAEAIEQYRQALAVDSANADAHTNWGNALVRIGRPVDALQHYGTAVRIRPDHSDAHLNWGVALAQQGRLDEAIRHFQEALRIKPDNREAEQYLTRASQLLRQAQLNGRSP